MNWDCLPARLLRYSFKGCVAHLGTRALQVHLTSVSIKLPFTNNLCQDTPLVAVCCNNYWRLCLTEQRQNGSLSSNLLALLLRTWGCIPGTVYSRNGFSFIYSQETEAVYKVYAFDKIKGLESERSCSDLLALLLTQMTVYGQQHFS